MGSVKGRGSSLGMAIMDEDMPDRAPKRPWADVEGMLPLQGQGQAATQSSGPAVGDKAIVPTKIARWLMEITRTKLALTTLAAAAALSSGGGGTGGGKYKYQKRSVSLSTLCVLLTVVAARDAS